MLSCAWCRPVAPHLLTALVPATTRISTWSAKQRRSCRSWWLSCRYSPHRSVKRLLLGMCCMQRQRGPVCIAAEKLVAFLQVRLRHLALLLGVCCMQGRRGVGCRWAGKLPQLGWLPCSRRTSRMCHDGAGRVMRCTSEHRFAACGWSCAACYSSSQGPTRASADPGTQANLPTSLLPLQASAGTCS